MPEFLTLLPPGDALNIFLENVTVRPEAEWIETSDALGRVAHREIRAPHALPSFLRSTVDGYAVRAQDTYGVSESLPGYLNVIGEILMGTQPGFALKQGQCAAIHTGGMLPQNANAVLMVEFTQVVSHDEIEILRPVADGENLIKPGEDIRKDEVILQAGKKVRAPEVGGLAALGITRIEVNRKPKVGILSSGDEVVPPDREIKPGQVRDINTYTLQAMVSAEGAVAVPYGILPDNLETLKRTAEKALRECEMLIFTAGSSASVRDLTAEVINQLGKPGVLVHGVNIRPGRPSILAVCQPDGSSAPKAVIGLPGNPVSALVIARLFVIPVIQKYLGLSAAPYQASITAKLSTNLPSQAGREDWVPVRIEQSVNGLIAIPVFGKSNLIFTLSRADGLICIQPEATGVAAGASVQVYLI